MALRRRAIKPTADEMLTVLRLELLGREILVDRAPDRTDRGDDGGDQGVQGVIGEVTLSDEIAATEGEGVTDE